MAEGFRIADGFIDVHAEVDHSELQRRVEAAVASISKAARTVNLRYMDELAIAARTMTAGAR